jgi:hypothetical protein
MAGRNEVHSGTITGSVVVAGSGNTINAKLRVELAKEPPSANEPVDIRAEFAKVRKVLEQLQTPDQGKIRRALDDAGEELAKPESNRPKLAARSNVLSTMQERSRVWVTKRLSSHHTSTSSPNGWAANGRAC